MATSNLNLTEAHTQWANRPADQRYQSLEALAAAVKSRRLRSRSIDVDVGTVSARLEHGTIALNRGMQSVEPTHWSFGQLSSWLKAPAGYLRDQLSPDLAVQCINHGIEKHKQSLGALKFMAITEEDRDLNTLQAVTSTTYGRIWDADCVDAVQRIVDRSNGRFYNPRAYAHSGSPSGFNTIDTSRTEPSGLYASDRDVFMFMIDGGSLLDVGPRAQLNRGFFVWNSEVGSRTFGLTTFLFNVVCGNHIVWGASEVNKLVIRHTANGPYRFDSEAAPALLAYANATAKPIEDQVRRAQAYRLTPGETVTKESLTLWCNKHGKFTRPEIASAYDFAKAEEGACDTLWHLVQGFTAYARGYDFIDARVDLETRAGKLLALAAN